MDIDGETDSEASNGEIKRTHGLSVACKSFKAALQVFATNSVESIFYLEDVPLLSEKDPLEYEACAKFSEAMLESKGIIIFEFKNMTFSSDLVRFVGKGLSDYDGLRGLSFENIKLVSPKAAVAVGEALKQRKPDEYLTITLREGDVSLLGPLMEANALIGGQLEISNLDVSFLDTRRHFRRWTLTATNVTELELKNVRGISNTSLNLLMKGLRNISNLSTLKLDNTRCSPGNLIVLKESLSILLEKYEANSFSLQIGNTGLNDAAVLKITELFVRYNKIHSICLDNVESSVAKRLISTRVILNQNCTSLYMENVNFLDETDFGLLFFALKRKEVCPSMILSRGFVHEKQKILLKQLKTDIIGVMFF